MIGERSYIVLEIEPYDYGYDLTFGGPGSARLATFSVPCRDGIVELKVKLDMFEPRVIACEVVHDHEDKVPGGKLSTRSAHRQEVLEMADDADSGLPARRFRQLWRLVRRKAR